MASYIHLSHAYSALRPTFLEGAKGSLYVNSGHQLRRIEIRRICIKPDYVSRRFLVKYTRLFNEKVI